jgi:tRNA dimethylallyltransferase
MSSLPPVIAVVGPTASGKSALALALAQAFGGEIVNADAFACYIGMDIGTAKPTADEQAQAPHHMVDVWQVEHDITVAEYQARARRTVDEIRARGRVPIVAGGSGLYVRSLLEPMEFPGTDPDIRAQLEADLAAVGTSAMHARLAALDPQAAAAIMATNGRRVVRAIEVVTITGRPYVASLPGTAAVYPDVRIGLDVPRPLLDAHIDARVDHMFAAGFVDEVAALEPRLRMARTASRAVGYGELLAHLSGQFTLDEARLTTASATRRLARKQLSWFRRDSSILWMDGTTPDLLERVRSVVAPRLGL